ALSYFRSKKTYLEDFENNGEGLRRSIELEDNDIWSALKVCTNHKDTVLSILSNGMINRKLFKIEITENGVDENRIDLCLDKFVKRYSLSPHEASNFISSDIITTDMYNEKDDSIDILYKDG